MRREGRLRGKPSSKSRRTGRRCRTGNHRCRDLCPDRPSEKAWEKRKHRCKRFAADVHTNPNLADFFLQPALTQLRGRGMEDEDELWRPLEETAKSDATVNSVIEAAFTTSMHGDDGGDGGDCENAAMACTTYELGGGAASIDLAGDDAATDIAAIELAFQVHLGIFENAVEGSSFSEFATQGWSTLSEESWSDVELCASDDETSPEDDWSVVDVDEADAVT